MSSNTIEDLYDLLKAFGMDEDIFYNEEHIVLAEAQKYLREKSSIIVTPLTDFIAWQVKIDAPYLGVYRIIQEPDDKSLGFKSYEDALEFGIRVAVKL